MIISMTMFVFLLGFAFLFCWMRLKYKRSWSFLNIVASAAICSLIATVVLYSLVGYMIVLTSYALAFLMLAVLVVGGTWLADKVLG
jgi:hypothetical protein